MENWHVSDSTTDQPLHWPMFHTKKFRNIFAPTEDWWKWLITLNSRSDYDWTPEHSWSSTIPECFMHAVPSPQTVHVGFKAAMPTVTDCFPPSKLWNKKSLWTCPNEIGPELMQGTRFFYRWNFLTDDFLRDRKFVFFQPLGYFVMAHILRVMGIVH